MIGLTSISGDAGRAIRLGQALNGNGFTRWEHAFVMLGGNRILEAEPGGARVTMLRYASPWWCEGIYRLLAPLNDPSRIEVAANELEGTPYSFLDYAALALHRLRVPAPGLRGFIASTGHEICSQLADDFYLRLGAHIYADGRWPGFITPGGLYQRDLELRKAT
jgi:hypothetical protein